MPFKKFNVAIKSKSLILIIALFWVSVMGYYKPWKQNLIIMDVVSYYGYLPATFIHKDITLKFIEKGGYGEKFWPEITASGGKVIKTTMGLSFLYAPFFLTADATAHMFNLNTDGYSSHYQLFLLLSSFFYLILGFHFLRKLLLLFFTDRITCLTMASVFFGTNLLWYSTLEALMSHSYLFSFLTIFIYLVVKWHSEPKVKTAILLGLTGGLVTLIRPTMILCFLIFILYNVYNKQSFLKKLDLFKSKWTSLILIGLCSFIVILPQLLYWKYITGDYLFFSYVGERFYWNNPHIIQGLFGFRKGWLIYTPIMTFAVIGIFYLRKNVPSFFLSLLILFPLLIYVFFSWWAWWYGGSFGIRAFVDFYGLLSIPMAAFYKQMIDNTKAIWKWVTIIVMSLLIYLNLFQTWQFKNHLIHYDSMTMEAYKLGFRKTYNISEWFDALEDPDYKRAKKGLPEFPSQDEVKNIKPTDGIGLKGYNKKVVSCEITSTKELTSTRDIADSWETFSLIYLEGNKIALKTAEGKFVSADKNRFYKLIGDRDQIGAAETFEIEYLEKGRIALKAYNGKYVSTDKELPYALKANGDKITDRETFRIYIN
jgi:hypothetical protein